MPSIEHEKLVDLLVSWVKMQNSDVDAQLFIDRVGPIGENRPMAIAGFVPDVLCFFPSINHTIVGDAKTPNDLETRHTKIQMEAFFLHLQKNGGTGELVIATRFEWVPSARGLLRSLGTVKSGRNPQTTAISTFDMLEY